MLRNQSIEELYIYCLLVPRRVVARNVSILKADSADMKAALKTPVQLALMLQLQDIIDVSFRDTISLPLVLSERSCAC